jgi:hypothetical protein
MAVPLSDVLPNTLESRSTSLELQLTDGKAMIRKGVPFMSIVLKSKLELVYLIVKMTYTSFRK